MARFARDCLEAMSENLHELEKELGPDTTDLGMRIGLHSGPVTAGVLRGDRARFQLFGDTVNTASRIETTGQKNRIHISEETANLLIKVGKDKWVQEREDKVQAKGKGELRTYWLKASGASSVGSSRSGNNVYLGYGVEPINEKHSRLVTWITEVMAKLLKQIVARRALVTANKSLTTKQAFMLNRLVSKSTRKNDGSEREGGTGHVLDEVEDIIMLPKFDAKTSIGSDDVDSVELKPVVMGELREYIYTIASKYSNNVRIPYDRANLITCSLPSTHICSHLLLCSRSTTLNTLHM